MLIRLVDTKGPVLAAPVPSVSGEAVRIRRSNHLLVRVSRLRSWGAQTTYLLPTLFAAAVVLLVISIFVPIGR
jgi:hypothetical protein